MNITNKTDISDTHMNLVDFLQSCKSHKLYASNYDANNDCN